VLRPNIEAYLQRWVPDRDAILQEMEQRAEAKHFPIVGPLVGRLLAQLTLLVSAQQILELGAGFGYSAYWFARALPTNDGLEVIQGLDGPFDIIFVDIDKEQYPVSLPLTLPRLRPGGLLITDNILWSGRVVVRDPPDASTRAIQEYTRLLYEDPNLHTTVIPLRDGVSVSLKV
jgi:predicted O-methyltransferase YrrM